LDKQSNEIITKLYSAEYGVGMKDKLWVEFGRREP
jgi:hypothetical protein